MTRYTKDVMMERKPELEKKLSKIIDKINECYYGDNKGHIGKCKSGETLSELLDEAKKTLKKMPILPEDERD